MNAVILIRANSTRAIKLQEEICRNYAKQLKVKVTETIYCDDAVTGSQYMYENFGKLLSAYKRHRCKIDMIIVSDTDRIAHSKRIYRVISGTLEGLGATIKPARPYQEASL